MSSDNEIRLVYARIPIYKNGKKVYEEVSIGDHYDFTFNSKFNKIYCQENQLFMKKFFSENQTMNLQIASIIGKNGVGKSLCIEGIVDQVLNFNNTMLDNESILIFADIDGYNIFTDMDIQEEYIAKKGVSQQKEEFLIFNKICDLNKIQNKIFLVYYSPQITQRKLSTLESKSNFLNFGYSYKLNKCISPINLNIGVRDVETEPAHMHGTYDTFQTTISEYYYTQRHLEQITLVLDILDEKSKFSSKRKGEFFSSIFDDSMPKIIKLTSDYIEYHKAKYKMDIPNKADIIGKNDSGTSNYEKSFYTYYKSLLGMKISDERILEALVNPFINRLIDGMFKDIKKNFTFNRLDDAYKKIFDSEMFKFEFNSEKNDAMIRAPFDYLRMQIKIFGGEFSDVISLELYDILSNIVTSYESLMYCLVDVIQSLNIDQKETVISNGINVEIADIKIKKVKFENGIMKLPEFVEECLEITFDLTKVEDSILTKLNDLAVAITDLDSWKLPIQMRWAYNHSTGEHHKLELFSMMYSAYKTIEGNENTEKGKSVIFMMDEPDTFMHPEWERNLIEEIVDLSDIIFKEFSNVQVLITTNKPVMVTDLPRYSVNYIGSEESELINSNTLYRDIHSLYRKDFFVSSNIGSFITKKVEELIRRLNIKENINEKDLDLINLIGDKSVSLRLREMYFNAIAGDSMVKFSDKIRQQYHDKDIEYLIELLKERK